MSVRSLSLLLTTICAFTIGCATTDRYVEGKRQRLEWERQQEIAAQGTGSIAGTVRDSVSGKPLAFAGVIALGTRRGVQADEKGRFKLTLVPAGNRRVKALSFDDSYRSLEVAVAIVEGTVSNVDFRLPPALPPWSLPNSIGVEVPRARHDLKLKLKPTRKRFRVGESATFIARIFYSGPDSVYLAAAPSGWSNGREFPRARMKINGPPDPRMFIDHGAHGVSPKQLAASDFYVLHKDEYIFATQGVGEDSVIHVSDLEVPGRYEVALTYSTQERDVFKWVRHDSNAERPSDTVLAMLRRMPMVELRDVVVIWVDP